MMILDITPRLRERAAADAAERIAARLGLDAATRADIARTAAALVRHNHSAAWALSAARRTARRAARARGGAA